MLSLIVLLTVITITQVHGQTNLILKYNGRYAVKPGDKMEYKFVNVTAPGFNYINDSQVTTNGTVKTFKLTQGTVLDIVITNSTITAFNQFVEGSETYSTPQGQTINMKNIVIPLVSPVFINKTILREYLNAISIMQPEFLNESFQINDTYYITNTNFNYNITSANGLKEQVTAFNQFVTNWHSGWVESGVTAVKYSNGTLYYSSQIERVLGLSSENGLLNTFSWVGIISIAGIVMLTLVAYRGYKREKSPKKASSFTDYVKDKIKKKKKKPVHESKEIEKSLEIIDEILKEN